MMLRSSARLLVLLTVVLAVPFGAPRGYAREAKQKSKWIRLSSSHFSILTDAGEKNGKEAILRLEQMRVAFGELLLRPKVTMPVPIDSIAFLTRAEYAQSSPVSGGQPIATSAFFLPGEDRSYIVLDLSDSEGWRAISRQFALLYLGYNYPPTQPWFDEGFADYFSSIRLSDTAQLIGGDPASFVEILNAQPWLPLTELFSVHPAPRGAKAAPRSPLFQAEAWIVMHYLLNKEKLPETGAYFGLAQNQKLPLGQAIEKAYGVSAAQLEQAVKSYFHSSFDTPPTPAPAAAAGAPTVQSGAVHASAPPLAAEDVGTSYVEVTIPEAQAVIAEMAARIPEHREAATKQLDDLTDQTLTETAIAHRALAWIHLQNHEYPEALEELGKARELDKADPWVHYYSGLVRFVAARAKGTDMESLPNTILDMRAVIDWNPDFAEAYNILGMAQFEGGGFHAAADSMHSAISLNPRSQPYLLNLAHIYVAGKKWDDATALLGLLKDSPDAEVAASARQDMADLPTLKKYGILPQRKALATAEKPVYSTPDDSDGENSSGEHTPAVPVDAGPDRRKVQFARGKLLSVDCSQPPAAVLKVSVGAQIMRMRTDDYKSLLLIGADEFSCEWKSVAVVVNYKAGGKAGGDLVSLELR